jgi:sulfoxide reductase heme-binding subunit YedZ
VQIQAKLFKNIVKPTFFIVLLLPLLYLLIGLLLGYLGANPVETIILSLGEWALVILLLALSLSPLSRIFKWVQLIQLRRMVGLFAFLYALLHFLSYIGFEQDFEISSVLNDIWERPFIAAGFAAFLILTALAITSTRAKRRQMGSSWKTLHRFVYLAVILCVLHFWWLVKADVSDPILYASLTALVLLERVWFWSKHKNKPRK